MDVPTERQHRVIELFCILTLSTSNPVMILQNSFARHCHLKKLVKSTDDLYLISYKCICFYNYLKIKSLRNHKKSFVNKDIFKSCFSGQGFQHLAHVYLSSGRGGRSNDLAYKSQQQQR